MKRGLLVLGLAVAAGACGDSSNNAQLSTSGGDASDRVGTIYLGTDQVTVEEGGTTEFDVFITDAPAGGAVVVTITSGDDSLITATPTLTFNEGNSKQTVTVNTNDDDVVGGSGIVKLTLTPSGATNYADLSAQEVTVTLRDDERTGGTAEPRTLTLAEGASATFSLALEGKPSGDVTVEVLTTDEEISVVPPTLTFTAENYDTPQMATVTAALDDEEEADEAKVIGFSATGGDYDGADLPDIGVLILGEGGTGGPTVSVVPQALTTSEDGTSATFTVSLPTTPPEGVTFTATADAAEGTVDGPVTVTPGSPVATFTVTGVDDDLVDGPQTYSVTLASTSESAMYNGLSIPPVSVTNNDNDGATITVSPMMVTLNENPPESATVTVTLNSDPGETVTITQMAPNARVNVTPNALVFTSANYGTPQTFTLTSIDNAMVTGDQMVMLDMSVSATQAYANYPITDVSIQLLDDDD